jgi:hypothetical protein
MDRSTAFMDLKYRFGFSPAAARALLDRAITETAACSRYARLYCYPSRSGQPMFKLAGKP